MTIFPVIKTLIFVVGLTIWSFGSFAYHLLAVPQPSDVSDVYVTQCPSGQASARLTGWALNNKMPTGFAKYNEATKQLEVSVTAVALPDATVLNVFAGDDRIGDLPGLKEGSASVAIGRQLADGVRIRVLEGDRPIVSANLTCDVSASASPAASPTESPTPSPTPSSSPEPTPAPTGEPVPDPVPKRTPMPSPSPTL